MATLLACAKPASQTERAYQAIKEMVMRGELRPGEVFSIFQLSDHLKLGRSPISSACQRLEYDGLVKVVPKQGVWINMLSIEDAKEVYESRVALECFYHRKALELYTQDDIAALKASIEKQFVFGAKGDVYAYMREDTFFHRYPMQKHKNSTLAEMYARLTDRMFMLGMKNAAAASRFQNAIEEHNSILSSIEANDVDGLVTAVERHIMNGYIELAGIRAH